MQEGNYIILDIGKTLSKLSLWRQDGKCIATETRNNLIVNNGAYQMLDVYGIESWLIDTLTKFAKLGKINAIFPIAHGAAVAVINGGDLACDPIDYEWNPGQEIEDEYSNLRDGFEITGAPHMENCLNMGIQLYYLKAKFAHIFTDDTKILPWAQFWAWKLSGVACTEVSSLGAHTDLWSSDANDYSPMAHKLGLSKHFAPMRKAGDIIGELKAELRQQTGINHHVKIYAGIHDSNAALLLTKRLIGDSAKEFTIVSTGTWFVAMRAAAKWTPKDTKILGQQNGVLLNIDIDGQNVPTSLFMGGREIETLIEGRNCRIDLPENQSGQINAIKGLIDNQSYIMPTATPGIGPFGGNIQRIENAPENDAEFGALVALYTALVTAYGLELIASEDIIIIEGRFSQSKVFCQSLANFMPNCKVYIGNEDANIAMGALCLMVRALPLRANLTQIMPLAIDLQAYKDGFIKRLWVD